ncbi:tetratricopeptide repeat protein, partial [Candidatus Sumerlaeota bacterium]|nr:tetratricopeptide repeat protein [Candidatus Sumerlaeota bacterium]
PRDPAERREDALGPNPFLGYDRESLGTYLMSRGALEIAESQFRRAIVVNPFEPRFKRRLAWRLFMQKRYDEAREWIAKALEQKPGDADSLQILRMMEEDLNRQRPSPTT